MTKVCPQCSRKYADASFEFCLDDGTKLIAERATVGDEPETHYGFGSNPIVKTETAALPKQQTFSNEWQPLQNQPTLMSDLPVGAINDRPQYKQSQINQTFDNSNIGASVAGITLAKVGENKAAAIAAVALAMAHNFWQWLYVARADTFEFASFAIWFLLLIAGTLLCLAVLKFNRGGKGFAVIGLIMLAINLLLYLVPHR